MNIECSDPHSGLISVPDEADEMPLRILHLEDDPTDVRLVRDFLMDGEVDADIIAVGNRADRLLERIPGYTLMRNLGKRFSGEADGVSFATALVEIEDALVPAFIVEEHADSSFTVFVPSVPTPAAGAVYVLPKERVHRVDVPMSTAVRCITQWGAGTGELLKAMHKSSDDLRLATPAAH